jgi:hypothetical protein
MESAVPGVFLDRGSRIQPRDYMDTIQYVAINRMSYRRYYRQRDIHVQLLSDNTELPRDLFMEALNRQLNTQV